MADTSGQALIRGIDIDKLAKGFADEANVFKNFVTVSNTSAREIRWYQKTAGFLDTIATDITTGTRMEVSERSRPTVVEQSWTRQTSYIKKYFVESPMISMEDIADSDIDILATNVRDLTRSVARKVDLRIFSVINEAAAATPTTPNPTTVNTAAAVGTGWDDATNGNPIKDMGIALKNFRANGYDPAGAVMACNPIEYEFLMSWLISTKGSSIPGFSSEKVKSGVVTHLMGVDVVVSENQTTDWVTIWIPSRAATWKAFKPITAAVMDEPGIGKKIRVWEEGECLLTDPKAVHVISDTTT